MTSPLETPPSRLTQICDLVVHSLNAAEQFPRPFTAKRYRNRQHALRDADNLIVAVMPEDIVREKQTRTSISEELTVAVAIIQRIPEPAAGKTIEDVEDELTDALMALAEELCDHLEQPENALPRLRKGERPIHSTNTIHVPYSHEHFEKRLFLCPISVTYRRL